MQKYKIICKRIIQMRIIYSFLRKVTNNRGNEAMMHETRLYREHARLHHDLFRHIQTALNELVESTNQPAEREPLSPLIPLTKC